MTMATSPQVDSAATRGPGRPKQSERDAAEVKEKLLDAATELAVEQGFEASGLREIARLAGVSPGMIGYYFGDRQGLCDAMFERIFSRIADRVETVMDDPEGSSEDRIAELVRIQVSTIAADPWLPTLVMRELLARNDSPTKASIGEAVARGPMLRMIEWLTEEQTRRGTAAEFDPRMLALTIASLTGFPFLMLPVVGPVLGIELDDALPEKLIEHNTRLLSNALRARPEMDE